MPFLRASSSVDLVAKSLLCRTSLLCLAKDDNKVFAVLKIIEERLRRGNAGTKAVLVTDDLNGDFIKDFKKAVSSQTTLSTAVCHHQECIDTLLNQSDIFITCPEQMENILDTISMLNVAVVIIDDCHKIVDGNSHIQQASQLVLSQDKNESTLVGLTSYLPQLTSNPQELEGVIKTMESAFVCQSSVSSKLVAMNKYGELPLERLETCASFPSTDNLYKTIGDCLTEALNIIEEQESCPNHSLVLHVSSLLNECYSVLDMFGSYGAFQTMKFVSKEIAKILKKLSKAKQEGLSEILESCKLELESLLNADTQEGQSYSVSSIVDEVISALSVLYTQSDSEDNIEEELPATPIKSGSTYFGKWKNENHVAVILAPSDVHSRALSELINHVAESRQLNYINSRFLMSSKIKTAEKGANLESSPVKLQQEPVMQQLQNGSANVLVVSHSVESTLYLPQCRLVVRLGIPCDYMSYIAIKSIPRSPQSQVLFIEKEVDLNGSETRYKVFKEIEKILLARCTGFQPGSLLCERQDNQASTFPVQLYAPYREEGPKITTDDSIAIINSYCSHFPSDGLGCPTPHRHTQVTTTDSQVMMKCTLYLPRNSPISQPFKGEVNLEKNSLDNPEAMKSAERTCNSLAALEACKALHAAGELDDSLQAGAREKEFVFKGMEEKCLSELVDGGEGRDGSLKRRRVYQRQVASVLKGSLPRAGQQCYVFTIHLELTKPGTHERAVRSQVAGQTYMAEGISMGIVLTKPLPRLPSFIIYDRAGEITVTIEQCSPGPVHLTEDQLSLIRRFHRYIFTDMLPLDKGAEGATLSFNPDENGDGYYFVLLEGTGHEPRPKDGRPSNADLEKKGDNSESELFQNERRHLSAVSCETLGKTDTCESASPRNDGQMISNDVSIAFAYLHSLEESLVSFTNPQDPPPIKTTDFELYRQSVLTTTYTKQQLRYYVADICYDESPSSPFPSPSVASTFGEYYKSRYDVELTADQPLLDVDHVPKRLNFVVPRYQTPKGKDRTYPVESSKRYQRSRVFLVPEMCSIHPIPASLWRSLTDLPSILYRVESLLLAEEFRQSMASQTGVGRSVWSVDQPLPLLTLGETVGEITKEPPCSAHASAHNRKTVKSKDENVSTGLEDSLINMDLHHNSECATEVSAPGPQCQSVMKDKELQSVMMDKDERPSQASGSILWGGENVDLPESQSPALTDLSRCVNTEDTAKHDSVETSAVSPRLHFDWDIEENPGPSSTLILRALTTNGASDIINNERLELYGDAFLKLAVSAKLYCDSPQENEGTLSFRRGLIVSNKQLYYLGRNHGFPSLVFNRFYEPLGSWIPPGFVSSLTCDLEEALNTCPSTEDEGVDEERFEDCDLDEHGTDTGDHPSRITSPQLHPSKFTVASDKTIADVVEAVIGAYLLTSGSSAALRIMEWLGIDVVNDENKQVFIRTCEKRSNLLLHDSEGNALGNPIEKDRQFDDAISSQITKSSSLIDGPKNITLRNTLEQGVHQTSDQSSGEQTLTRLTSPYGSECSTLRNPCAELSSIESVLGYSFNNKKLLQQAFTHVSYPRGYSSVKGSNEQLEFLGDALLDYLITRHILHEHPRLSCGALTDMRSAVVNNYSLAWLTVKYGFHTHLRSLSVALFRIVGEFVAQVNEMERKHVESKPDQVFSKVFLTLDEAGDCQATEVPKPLGDLFEAVVGAVYVDTGLDEERTWRILYPLLRPIIDHYSHNPPISPVRQLLEMLPGAATFMPANRTVTGVFTCTLTVKGYGTFTGSGRTPQIAKSSAAQRALVKIQKQRLLKASC